MRTFKEYQEKLNSMRKNVYINGAGGPSIEFRDAYVEE